MIGTRTFTEPTAGQSLLHRLDPRAKIVALVCFSLLAITLDTPRSLGVLLVLAILAYLPSGVPWARFRVLAGAALLMTWGTMVGQALFYAQEPRTVVLILLPAHTPVLGPLTQGIYVYREGFIYGAVQSLRMVAMFALGLLFAWTTDPRDALYGLTGLGVPYGVAFMVITALRFMPILMAEAAVVVNAQRLRGMNPRRTNPVATLRMALLVLKPTLANSLRRAGTLTLSVQSRAFDPAAERSNARGLRWGFGLIVVVCAMVALTGTIIALKGLYLLYANEIYYRSGWRTLYAWAREYL